MNRRGYEPKVIALTRPGGESPPPDLTELLWMSGGGVARAVMLPDGSITGMRLGDDSLIEVWIKKPTK
jgi:hypothetical protein